MTHLPAHYETVRERNGYESVDGRVGPVGAGERRRFVAVDDPNGVLATATERRTLVTTGVGMTGPPHLGTVGQFLTVVALQEAGLDVQFVIADLEPYHSGAPLDRVRALAERYCEFALDLGFDPDRGRLRTQSEARDVMHTAYLLAPYYDPDGWEHESGGDRPPTDWERATREAYEAADERTLSFSGATSDAAAAHSSVLHGADFLHPLYAGEYEALVLLFGIDEHHLTPMARRFRDTAPVDGRVAGVYTRMLPGFDGTPKMSKSIPGSGISLAMDEATIRQRIASDGGGDPASSPVFGAMSLASDYERDRLDRIESACEAGGRDWERAKATFADEVVDLAERWRTTGE